MMCFFCHCITSTSGWLTCLSVLEDYSPHSHIFFTKIRVISVATMIMHVLVSHKKCEWASPSFILGTMLRICNDIRWWDAPYWGRIAAAQTGTWLPFWIAQLRVFSDIPAACHLWTNTASCSEPKIFVTPTIRAIKLLKHWVLRRGPGGESRDLSN